MPDLTLVQLKQAYDAALEQIAAESFLQKGMPLDMFIARLQLGNNPIDADPTKPDLIGKLRMTQSQAGKTQDGVRHIFSEENEPDPTARYIRR